MPAQLPQYILFITACCLLSCQSRKELLIAGAEQAVQESLINPDSYQKVHALISDTTFIGETQNPYDLLSIKVVIEYTRLNSFNIKSRDTATVKYFPEGMRYFVE